MYVSFDSNNYLIGNNQTFYILCILIVLRNLELTAPISFNVIMVETVREFSVFNTFNEIKG